MRTIPELMAIEDDERFAGAFNEGCDPGGRTFDPEFAGMFNQIFMFQSFMACDGFGSLFLQIVPPEEWPAYEAFLAKIGASRFCALLQQARRIYFGGDHLPGMAEWGAFQSIIWTEPEGAESREFDRVAQLAEEAYHTDHVLRKLGAYLRRHWAEICREKNS